MAGVEMLKVAWRWLVWGWWKRCGDGESGVEMERCGDGESGVGMEWCGDGAVCRW